jgi:hypothetical protein
MIPDIRKVVIKKATNMTRSQCAGNEYYNQKLKKKLHAAKIAGVKIQQASELCFNILN